MRTSGVNSGRGEPDTSATASSPVSGSLNPYIVNSPKRVGSLARGTLPKFMECGVLRGLGLLLLLWFGSSLWFFCFVLGLRGFLYLGRFSFFLFAGRFSLF